MGLKLYLEDVQDIVFETGKHKYNIDRANTSEINMSYNYKNFKGCYKEIVLENFKISYNNSFLSEKTTLFFEFSEEETVEMHFALQGNSLASINNLSYDFSFDNNTHNILYCNDTKGKIEYNSKDLCILEINLQPRFFEQYLPDSGLFNAFKKIIKNTEIGFLVKHNYLITPSMLTIIHEIINCPWKDEYRKLFMEAKVLELLLLQLDQIGQYNLCSGNYNTSKTIIDKIHYAKEIILGKLNSPMHLVDLAKVVGTNECTLKKEFKHIFGTTVFGYIRDSKMEEAKNMLLNLNLPVKEVSDMVGYKNPQHFSTAFKRKFGVSPSVLLKK